MLQNYTNNFMFDIRPYFIKTLNNIYKYFIDRKSKYAQMDLLLKKGGICGETNKEKVNHG